MQILFFPTFMASEKSYTHFSHPAYEQYAKYRNFTKFPCIEILWKGTVFAYFWANRPNLRENYAFPQKFHQIKLVEVTVFFAVKSMITYYIQ